MGIHYAKPYTLRGGPSTKLEQRLFKAWQLNNHSKNSSISSKPDHAYICTISGAIYGGKEQWGSKELKVEGKAGSKGILKGERPLEEAPRGNGGQSVNLPPLLAAHFGRGENGQPLQSSLTSAYGGQTLSNNIGGNLPSNDDTLQILGLHEEQRISGFVHGLRTRSLVQHLSTDLPSTYKGLMEKTYTWLKQERGQKNKDRFSPYRGPNHGLLPSLSKSLMEILATKKAARSFEPPSKMFWKYLRTQIQEAVNLGQLSHLVKGIKKERTKSSDTLKGESKKDKRTAPSEAPILMVSRESYIAKSLAQENTDYGGKKIIFPLVAKVNNAPVIIEAKIFGRKVGRVYMDCGSSCEIIYEHCFEKLNPSIKATKVDLKTPLVGFSRERSWSIGEVPLQITIGDAPLSRTETLKFIIV
ncbi:hypothetical protein Tco_1373074, partial [Tanacetum coccineum]